MSLFFVIAAGAAIGTFIGNSLVFWLIGIMAQRQQEVQKKELEQLQQSFLEMRAKEQERMERYAKMEG